MISIYFLLNAFETALLAVYLILDGSESSQQVFFNLSWPRLIMVSVITLAAIGFIYLFFACLKKTRMGEWIGRIIHNERINWFMQLISVIVFLASLVLLSRNADRLGAFRNYYLELQPIFAWISLLSIQAVFGCVLNIVFVLNFGATNPSHSRKEYRNVWMVFIVAAIIKLLLVTRNSSGPINWDGMEYFFSAYFMNQGQFFTYENAIHYPPLYYLLFLWTIPFDQYAYDLIKIINIVFSTSLIFPVYLTARKFLNAKECIWIVILSSLLPFHLVFPPRIQSENLYFPLFCWVVYLVLTNPKDKRFHVVWDLMTGVCLGALYLTRYITLAALPAFFFGWWMKPFDGDETGKKNSAKRFMHLCLVGLAAGITYIPWVITGMAHGNTLKNMLGFVITAVVENPAQLSFANLLKWAMIYICYLILMAAPMLHLIFLSLKQAAKGKLDIQKRNWFLFVTALLASYGAAVVRHSWRENYNSELPTKIMGRYFIFIAPILLITAMMGLDKFKREKGDSFLKYFITTIVVPFVLVVFAYLCDITRSIVPMADTVIKKWGSVDGYLIVLMDKWFLLAILVILLLTGMLLWKGKKKQAFVWLCGSLVVYQMVCLPAFSKNLQEYDAVNALGKQAAMEIIETYPNEYATRSIRLYVPDSFDKYQKQRIYMSTRIRGIHQLELLTYYDSLAEADLNEGDFIVILESATTEKELEYEIQTYPFDVVP